MKLTLGICAVLLIGLAFAIGPDTVRYIKISRM